MSPETPLHHRAVTNGLPSDHIPKRSTMEPNVLNIVLGTLLVKPWYPSFYPEELVGRTADRLYVCQWCFKYSKELMPFLGHVVRQSRFEQLFNLMLISSSKKACPLKDAPPPGTAIYTKDGYSIHEIDGEEHKVPYPKSLTFRTQGLSSLI